MNSEMTSSTGGGGKGTKSGHRNSASFSNSQVSRPKECRLNSTRRFERLKSFARTDLQSDGFKANAFCLTVFIAISWSNEVLNYLLMIADSEG